MNPEKKQGRTKRPPPRETYPRWPHDESATAEAGIVQTFVANLAAFTARQADSGVSQAEVCRRAGVAKATLSKVLHGDVWPDSLTVARFEQLAGTRLWDGKITDPNNF